MVRLLRPFGRAVTYTRLLHLFVTVVWPAMLIFIQEAWWIWALAAATLVPAGLVPAMRTVEGLQARLLLTGHRHDSDSAGIVVAPSASWADRWRLVLWLEARFLLGCSSVALIAQLLFTVTDLVSAAVTSRAGGGIVPPFGPALAWRILLVPVLLAVLAATVWAAGRLITALAVRLLGPSPAERLAALEERTEQLLERTRIARELHDSIGHALTVAVLQAGAARAADDPAFTRRALDAIEETGRAALEDLERVLGVLRDSGKPADSRPTLSDAGRLLESARASGAEVDADLTGSLEGVPGPVSREGYRILQESLTNVLRHAGPVPARVHVSVEGAVLRLDVRNPLPADTPVPGRGSGLRGMHERAALLGGRVSAGPVGDDWRVHVELPVR
ncbi:sensor histidine kinase [Streptomyces sp. NPDC059805]|uniref:sensor histidine kinase n=1 Tax=Streptomyces sp. NPDC059805 TaxID=3346954 RepID=UPI003663E9E6